MEDRNKEIFYIFDNTYNEERILKLKKEFLQADIKNIKFRSEAINYCE